MILLLKQTWLDIRMGVCSGFRPCCITFFVLVWSKTKVINLNHKSWKSRYWKYTDGAEYVPCPLCILLKRKPIQVKSCTPECGHHDEATKLRILHVK